MPASVAGGSDSKRSAREEDSRSASSGVSRQDVSRPSSSGSALTFHESMVQSLHGCTLPLLSRGMSLSISRARVPMASRSFTLMR